MSKRNGKLAPKRAQRYILAALVLAAVIPSFAQSSSLANRDRIQRTVLISIPDRTLVVLEDGDVIASFPIAVGAPASPSPTGEFQIVNRVTNPTYYHPGTVIPSGKDNPVGTRWLGLSQKGFGIHGTNEPKSVGHAASHGCIRLRNRDVEKLFTMLRVGDVVQIRGERNDEIAQIFDSEGGEVSAGETDQASGR